MRAVCWNGNAGVGQKAQRPKISFSSSREFIRWKTQ